MLGTILLVSGHVKIPRAYHSPLRAEQADQTRQRVLAAASTLFLTRGYAGTTVKGVAEAAGVSPDTIYASLGGKKGLLESVWAMAVTGPNDPDRRAQQDRIRSFAALPDPRERLRRLVGLSCETLGRASPIHAVLRAAADGHPFAADLQERMLASRLDTQSRNLRVVLGDALRPGLGFDVAAEHYSALLSPELFHLLTVTRAWAPDQYESWVADTLTREFLDRD
jgi:AcrR family transcriptional regulator